MLSIGKLNPARADYYVEQVQAGRDEYYTADQAEPGYWVGRAAPLLGLEGNVDAEAFRRVLDAQHPATGEDLGVPRTTANRIMSTDRTGTSCQPRPRTSGRRGARPAEVPGEEPDRAAGLGPGQLA